MRRLCPLFAVMALVCGTSSAEIYKWKDENGRVHYGTTPPNSQHSEQVKVDPGREPVPQPQPQPQMAESTSESVEEPWEETCGKAVRYSNDSLDKMILSLEKNYRDGYMKKAGYLKRKNDISKFRVDLTSYRCLHGSDEDKAIFKCLAASYGNLMGCAKQAEAQK